MYRVIIQHGSFGSPSGNWFPWLKEKIESSGRQCFTPQLPIGADKQSLSTWLEEFNKQVPKPDEQTILVGHSIACAFFISLLEELKTPVKAMFLASGFLKNLSGDPLYEKVNRTFLDLKHDWKLLRKLCGKVYQYASTDDPYVPFSLQEELAKNLNTKITVIEKGGHLNSETGFTKFPRLWEDLSILLRSAT
jgi:hypothetical protein